MSETKKKKSRYIESFTRGPVEEAKVKRKYTRKHPPLTIKEAASVLFSNSPQAVSEITIVSDSTRGLLNEREKTYGDFMSLANIAQNLKEGLRVGNWRSLSNDKKEALEMVMSKIARILNGDPEYKDSWVDCIGYITLVKMKLEEKK